MSLTLAPEQTWTNANRTPALIEIESAVQRLQRGRCDTVEETIVAKASSLLLYLEQHPTVCTPESIALCRQLLSMRAA